MMQQLEFNLVLVLQLCQIVISHYRFGIPQDSRIFGQSPNLITEVQLAHFQYMTLQSTNRFKTRRDTFLHVKNWLDEAKANGNPNLQILLVGNKNDLSSSREVTLEQGNQLAKDNGLNFIQTNSKDYEMVQQVFVKLTGTILSKIDNQSIIVNQAVGIKIGNLDNSKFQSKQKISSKNVHKKQCC